MSPSELEELIAREVRQQPQNLDLADKNLLVLPDSIGKITSLKSLTLGKKRSALGAAKRINQLTTLPSEISQLINLETLVIANNKLSHFPVEITELRNLTSLDLSRNQITEIPDAIAQLKNLRSLDLSNNQIRKIPDAIAELPNLTSLNVGGNPIVTPPLEIVEKGIRAIQEYFRQIKTEGEDYLYEAKLLIVGEAGAGKTTLANIIKDMSYKLQQEDTTKGIEVLRWTFARGDGKLFTVNIWDFGGQEIYHATHQYFLTKRSLYLLVADNRKEDTDFYYWLNTIDLLSENSPVLIINNKKENRQREININQLRGEFENLSKVIATNLANNHDRDAIISDCKYHLNQLPHIGDRLPKTWVKVRKALEGDLRNYISHEEYLQICEDKGYREEDYEFKLSEYFHDLGICLHFQKDTTSPLYNIVILKPKWATDAAYAVLDKPEIINNFGRFTKQDLAKIWSDQKYRGMHDKLLELMKKFQLCYEIPQSNGIYIAPQLLTENQPEYAWDESENLILRYTYDFMPKGMVRKFIVAMHESIEAQIVWRSGVIINKQEISDTYAEVIENYDRREIKIRVSGKNKRDLLTIVTHEIDKIHNSYKRLADKYQKLIPCNCNTCKGSQNPHSYEFANLKRRYENRKYTVECDISYQDVDVLGLIDDIGARSQLQDPSRNLDPEDSIDYDRKDKLNIINKIYVNNQQQQQQGGAMDNEQQQQSNSDNSQQQQQSQSSRPLHIKSSWANGSFYLFLFVVVIGGIGYLAGTLKLLNLIAVIVAGTGSAQ